MAGWAIYYPTCGADALRLLSERQTCNVSADNLCEFRDEFLCRELARSRNFWISSPFNSPVSKILETIVVDRALTRALNNLISSKPAHHSPRPTGSERLGYRLPWSRICTGGELGTQSATAYGFW